MNRKTQLFLILSFLIFFLIIFVFFKKPKDFIELTQLHDNSASQMMGYFIKTNNDKIIVIDGGTVDDSKNLQKYINDNGGKVDYWFLTHFHLDHSGALTDIINNTSIPIENIIYHECPKEMIEKYETGRIPQYELVHIALQNDRVKQKIIDPKENQIFEFSNNVNIKIISVYENDITENLGNNTSTVFKMNVNDKSILFLGDTGIQSSDKLLKNHKNDLKSDYVQMAHHGQNGATFELYRTINPTYCLWPTPAWLWDNNPDGGEFNSGPYKTIETRDWMKQLNVKENYIEKDGDITIKIE